MRIELNWTEQVKQKNQNSFYCTGYKTHCDKLPASHLLLISIQLFSTRQSSYGICQKISFFFHFSEFSLYRVRAPIGLENKWDWTKLKLNYVSNCNWRASCVVNIIHICIYIYIYIYVYIYIPWACVSPGMWANLSTCNVLTSVGT